MPNFSDHDAFEISQIDKSLEKLRRKITDDYEALTNAGVASEGDYRNRIAQTRNAIATLEAERKKITDKYEQKQPAQVIPPAPAPPKPPSKNDFIETIRQYVEQGATEEAVALLRLQIAEHDPGLLNGAISLSGRYRRAKDERLNNRISRDDYERTLAQIDHAILELLPKKAAAPPPVQKEEKESDRIKEPEMIFVQGGSFKMGSNNDDTEKPIHTVTLNSFYIGKYPITVAQFAEFIRDSAYVTTAETEDSSSVWTGSKWEDKKGVFWKHGVGGSPRLASEYNHPVVHVSWADAAAYCEWLSQKTGKKYRRPAEAQWEYAARGGKKTREYIYSGSNDVDKVAWYSKNSGKNTHEVGNLDGNELEIHDMSGNVWEWCEDFWHENYKNAPSDGSAWLSGGDQRYRVCRGGSWSDNGNNCPVAFRDRGGPSIRDADLGFRVARGD